MVTFHGVFDGGTLPVLSPPPSLGKKDGDDTTMSDGSDYSCQVLICNGQQDPFVKSADVDTCVAILQGCGHHVRVLQLEGAKHGFSNPAQDFNDNNAFAFCASAATLAWAETLRLLKTACEKV
jgi:dienelactone hydrolase